MHGWKGRGKSPVEDNAWVSVPAFYPLVQGKGSTGEVPAARVFGASVDEDAPSH